QMPHRLGQLSFLDHGNQLAGLVDWQVVAVIKHWPNTPQVPQAEASHVHFSLGLREAVARRWRLRLCRGLHSAASRFGRMGGAVRHLPAPTKVKAVSPPA